MFFNIFIWYSKKYSIPRSKRIYSLMFLQVNNSAGSNLTNSTFSPLCQVAISNLTMQSEMWIAYNSSTPYYVNISQVLCKKDNNQLENWKRNLSNLNLE